MRFLVMVKGNKEYEAGAMPKREELLNMDKFNDELIKAGVNGRRNYDGMDRRGGPRSADATGLTSLVTPAQAPSNAP